jgi:hypothetical protein
MNDPGFSGMPTSPVVFNPLLTEEEERAEREAQAQLTQAPMQQPSPGAFDVDQQQQQAPQFTLPQVPNVGHRGDLIGQARQAGAEHRRVTGQALDDYGRAAQQQQGAIAEQIQRSDEIAKERERVFDDTMTRKAAIEGSEAELRTRKAQSMERAKQEVTEAKKDARYFGLDRDERKRLEDIVSDESRSDRERAQAKSKLQSAQDIDPDRALGGAGGKVMAAIAMALGAYGSSINGGPNHAMQIINAAIDRDIQSQLERKRSREKGIDDARQEMSDERTLFADEMVEMDRMRVRALEATKMKLERTDSQLQSVEQKSKLQQLNAQIDQQQAAMVERIATADYQNTMSEVGTVAALRGQQDAAAMQRYQAESGMIAAALKAESEGKSLVARQASELGDLDAAEKLVGELEGKFRSHTGKGSILSQWFPMTGANEYNQALTAVARQLALSIEGTANKDSVNHYRKMLGSAATDKGTAAANFANMRRNIKRVREGRVGAFQQTGYNTGEIRGRSEIEDTLAPAQPFPGV